MKIMKHLKAALVGIGITVAACLMPVAAHAQPYYGLVPQAQVTSAGGSAGQSGTVWTNSIAGGVTVTNVTLLSGPGIKDLALEINQASAGASTSNVVWTFARNVSGGTATNALGSNLKLELFATVTNTLAATANVTKVVTLGSTSSSQTGVATTGALVKGAVPYVYLYSISVPASSTALTNYSVYATGL